MCNFTWNRFPIKNLLIDSLLTPITESAYLVSMMVSLIFPFLFQMLGFCCFIQHIVGSGPRVVTFSKNLACTSKKVVGPPWPVLPLCCYGKVLDFMIKKHYIHKKNTRLQKQTYTEWKWPENALQCQPLSNSL